MNNYRRWFFAFISGLLLVLLATVWDIFAPLPLGGQASYVIVNGNSMEPGFHLGDLVIVHSAPSYAIGDEVVYRDADLKRYVFHRIVGQDLDHFLLQGDNNTWVDSYHPTAGEILGKDWINLPGVGKAITWLRTPTILAVIVALIGTIFMVVIFILPKEKRGRKIR
jgi:signal peptidase I